MCGHYPGRCPSRPNPDDVIVDNLSAIRTAGICTFVCLQDELPPQDADWPEDGVEKKSERAPWAKGNFQNYKRLMPTLDSDNEVSYVHYKLPDLSIAKSLNDLDQIVSYLVSRIQSGDKLYIHCWGGRGRTGLISACVLGALYEDITAQDALDRVQTAYSLREPWLMDADPDGGKKSPETEEQRLQVRDWFCYKREGSMVSALLRETKSKSNLRQLPAFGIWNKKGTKLLEIVSPITDEFNNRLCDIDGSCFQMEGKEDDADKLGNGRFGLVFRGRCENSPDHYPVAIKVTYNLEDAPTHQQSKLALEAKVLRAMSGVKGFPKVLHDSRQKIFQKPSDVLVMQLLGRPLLKRVWDEDYGDVLCSSNHKSFTIDAVMKIGRDVLNCLQHLHKAGYTHNDLKPNNMLFGAQGDGEGEENDVHLVDFGMVTELGQSQDDFVDGCKLQAGGASPVFASLAQLEGRPTRPVDDVESLWYILAWLVQKELPWQWEPVDRLRNIKKRLFEEECGISSDVCSALLGDEEDCCSTKHCRETVAQWNVPDALHELWGYVLEGNEGDGTVDYDGCLEALGGDVGKSDDDLALDENEKFEFAGPIL